MRNLKYFFICIIGVCSLLLWGEIIDKLNISEEITFIGMILGIFLAALMIWIHEKFERVGRYDRAYNISWILGIS